MYLTRFVAKNIKCFAQVELDFPKNEDGTYAGWHVLLGTNATGKTTLLQAIAVGLIGASAGMRLISPATWVRRNEKYGEIDLWFRQGEKDASVGQPRTKDYQARLAVTGETSIALDGQDYTFPQIVLRNSGSRGKKDAALSGLIKGPYASDKTGWLVSGFGSFRRFMGGSDHELTYDRSKVGRVASLFKESVALDRSIKFLPDLYARSQDKNLKEEDRQAAVEECKQVGDILNDLLPAAIRFARVDTQQVFFNALGIADVALLDLSDGYRSFLALVLELLRQISEVFGSVRLVSAQDGPHSQWCVNIESVVLIDEADLRLHPSWQREFGPKLRKVFPKVQFIVTSHSPFMAQEASPNGLFVLRPAVEGSGVSCHKPLPRVDGWNTDEILQSPLFGLTSTVSVETEVLLQEHASLRGLERFGTLNQEQKDRLKEIEGQLAEQMTSPFERDRRQLEEAIREAAARSRGVSNA